MKLIITIILSFSLNAFSSYMYSAADIQYNTALKFSEKTGLSPLAFIEAMEIFDKSGLTISSYYNLSIENRFHNLKNTLSRVPKEKRKYFMELSSPKRTSIARYWKHNLDKECSIIMFIDAAVYTTPYIVKKEAKLLLHPKKDIANSLGYLFAADLIKQAKGKKKLNPNNLNSFYGCKYKVSRLDDLERLYKNKSWLK